MDTDKHGFNLPEGEHTHAIVGAAFEVINTLGHGLHEKPYENALVVELGARGLGVEQQQRFVVTYKGVQVGEFVPDIIVNSTVIVDTKVVDHIADNERGQMLNYLRIARLKVGLIINFKHPKLEWQRIVL